jgi:hypothetical protein
MLYTCFLLENLDEYLRLQSNADKPQLQQIHAVFDRKDQECMQNIGQLQKKYEIYNKKLRDLEMYGLPSSQHLPQKVLKDMGQRLK